jgi:hypothetical protein
VFQKMQLSRGTASWNWAAFFFNFCWLAYRKLYVQSAIVAGAILVPLIIAGAMKTQLTMVYLFGVAIPLAIAIGVGVLGDSLLKKRADAVIADAQQRYPDPQMRLPAIAAAGGVSGPALAAAIVGWLAIQAVLYAANLSLHDAFEQDRYRPGYYFRR